MNSKVLMYFLKFLFFFSAAPVFSQVYDYVVDINGNGNFTSINEALNSISENSTTRTLIFVRNGVYNEKVWLGPSKISVSLVGENVDDVVINWDDYQGKDGLSGADSYTFLAEGDDFYMENITVVNSYGSGSQAVAIRTTGDRQVFKNCVFKGHQDTYYAHKNRQYNFKCIVEGNTDFIYGDATAVFDSCIIKSLNGGNYIAAPADSKLITPLSTGDFYHGFLFSNCNLTAEAGVDIGSVYLARPWQANASVAYIYCILGDHISPTGWSEWSTNDNHESAYFSEYLNKNVDGNLADVTQRVSWSTQLTEYEATVLYLSSFFLRKENVNWFPKPVVTALHAPLNVSIDGIQLVWDPVDEAIGYAIYKNGRVIDFASGNSFVVSEPVSDLSVFKVLSIDEYGALSDGTEVIPGFLSDAGRIADKKSYQLINNKIFFSHPTKFLLFDISGCRIIYEQDVMQVSLSELGTGVYFLYCESEGEMPFSDKLVIRR
ncbi:pectinesterase family protein [Geofilum sp. OHC36d9]|uniref:pectinesterase family protein n=1 Tax=Geofilum sp. OHC36d9 TaxID=3458413 RepID=UPI0040342292